MGMAEALSIDNEFLRDIAITTVKLKRGDRISLMDEVFVYYDMYMLTQDPYSAAWGWMEWGKDVGLHD